MLGVETLDACDNMSSNRSRLSARSNSLDQRKSAKNFLSLEVGDKDSRKGQNPSSNKKHSLSSSKTNKRKDYQIDYIKRAQPDYVASEISDGDLPFEYSNGQPKEMIFAELTAGSYFGELGLHSNDSKEMQRLRDVREGRCYTSVWSVQNTHLFYLKNEDYL